MAIVAVFCAGLGKLWWNNRLMKKQEALDEEKRARVEEIRKTGLPMKRGNQVPFGVRAIQSGVEVDGIWISRPASLNELGEKHASSTTLGRDSDSQNKRRDYSEDEKSVVVTTAHLDRSGPKQSPSTASIFQKLTDTDSTESTHSAAPPVSQFAYSRPKRQSSRPTASGTLNEDTLRRLEGHSPSKQTPYGTYVPTSPPCRPNPRSSASSSADSVDSQPRSAGGASGRSYASSSHSSRLYMMSARGAAPATNTTPTTAAAAAATGPGGRSGHETAASDPFATPRTARTPSGLSAFSMASETASSARVLSLSSSSPSQVGQQQPQQQQQQQREMAVPEPTFGPGDLHYNRGARRG